MPTEGSYLELRIAAVEAPTLLDWDALSDVCNAGLLIRFGVWSANQHLLLSLSPEGDRMPWEVSYIFVHGAHSPCLSSYRGCIHSASSSPNHAGVHASAAGRSWGSVPMPQPGGSATRSHTGHRAGAESHLSSSLCARYDFTPSTRALAFFVVVVCMCV